MPNKPSPKPKNAKSVDPEELPVPSFRTLLENKDLAFQAFEKFPIPVEVFAPDGTSIFLNQAFKEVNHIIDEKYVINKYNTLNDPVMEQMGLSDGIQRAFWGENVIIHDVDIPVQDLVNRGIVAEKPFEKSFADFYLSPVMDGQKVAFVVFVCIFKRLYQGRPDLALAREYIETHWKEEFDIHALAKHVNISVTPLYTLFKKYTGMTPGEYYRKCKVDHIKEMLADKNLSVKAVFNACGADSRGAYAKIFKKLTGLSPTQFRENPEKK